MPKKLLDVNSLEKEYYRLKKQNHVFENRKDITLDDISVKVLEKYSKIKTNLDYYNTRGNGTKIKIVPYFYYGASQAVILRIAQKSKQYKDLQKEIDVFWKDLKKFVADLRKCVYDPNSSAFNIRYVINKFNQKYQFRFFKEEINRHNREYEKRIENETIRKSKTMIGKTAEVKIGGKVYIAKIEQER